MTRQLITRLILCPACTYPISASYTDADFGEMSDICTECRAYLSKDQIKEADAVPDPTDPTNDQIAKMALRDVASVMSINGPEGQASYLALAQVHATLAVADRLAELVTGVEASLELQQENNQRLDTLTAMIVDKAAT